MNKSLKTIGVIITSLSITSCADKKIVLPTSEIVKTEDFKMENKSSVTFKIENYINSDKNNSQNKLNVVKRSDTAYVTGLKILSFGAMLFSGGGYVNGFTKEDLKGNNIDNIDNPFVDYTTLKTKELINSININLDNSSNITLTPVKFKLIYDALDDDNYVFEMSGYVTFRGSEKSALRISCNTTMLAMNDRIKRYGIWEKNNYDSVMLASKKVIDVCFKRLNDDVYRKAISNALSGKLTKFTDEYDVDKMYSQ